MGLKAELPEECPPPPGAEPCSAAGWDLEALVTDHHAALYRYAYRLTGSVHDAEDLTQQTFLVAREKLAQVRAAEHVRGWLCAVLRNGYLKSFRQHVPTPAATLGLNLDGIAEEAGESLIDSEQLQAALEQVPGDFRLVLLMFYFEQLSYREIATALAIPLGTVMSRLARAKNCLRNLLRPPAALPAQQPATTSQPGAANPLAQQAEGQAASWPLVTRPEIERSDAALTDTTTSFLPFSPGSVAHRR